MNNQRKSSGEKQILRRKRLEEADQKQSREDTVAIAHWARGASGTGKRKPLTDCSVTFLH